MYGLPGEPSSPQVLPGYGMPASTVSTAGSWFDKLLNVAATGYQIDQNRKLEEARMQQEALIRSVERDSNPAAAPASVASPVSATVPRAQWIQGVDNKTVMLAGAAILVGAMVLK